jgi:hypothetical protein
MPFSARRLDLRTLRPAVVTVGGDVEPVSQLTAGTLLWPWMHAHRVLHEWRLWLEDAGDVVASSAALLRAPRARPLVAVDQALATEPGAAAERLAPLRRLAPDADTVRPSRPAALRPALARMPAGAAPLTGHLRLRELPAAAVDAFVAAAGPGSGSELIAAELHRVGGGYALAAIGAAYGGDDADRVRIALEQVVRRLTPWA